MRQLSRAIARLEVPKTASVFLAIAWLGLLGAFAFGSYGGKQWYSAIAAAAATVPIAGAALLYAWRRSAPPDI